MTVTVKIGVQPVPAGQVVAALTIRHGRGDVFDGPTSSTASLVLLGDWPTRIAVGSDVAVDVDGVPRFRGQITDMGLEWVDDVAELSLVCAGNVARIARRKVGYGAWPVESWAARVDRVMSEAGWTAYAQDTPRLTTLMVAARLAGETTVSAQLEDLAATAGACICDTPDGTIWFQPLSSRQPIAADPVPLAVPPDRVAYAPAWTQVLDVVNSVTVAYGPEEDSHTHTSTAPDSIALFGQRTADIGGTLASDADATLRGQQTVTRRGFPRWTLPSCDVLGVFTPRIGQAVYLTQLPPPSPLGDTWGPVVEGWEDRLDGVDWTTTLVLSDPVASGVSLPWQNLPPTLKWSAVDPVCTWANAYRLENVEL